MVARLPVFAGGIVLGFGLTYLGGWPFRLLVVAAWLGILVEISLAASRALQLPHRKYLWLDLLFFGPLPLSFVFGFFPVVVVLGCLWLFILFLFFPPNHAGLCRWLMSTVVQPYVALGVCSFFLLREMSWEWPACALGVVILADTGAYLIGRGFGRRLLAPSISPAKTVEGAAGGFILSSAACAFFLIGRQIPVPTAVLASAVLAMLAVLGDLFESFLKRGLGLKDFGTILPGHGGLFDRLDSLLPVSTGLLVFLKLL